MSILATEWLLSFFGQKIKILFPYIFINLVGSVLAKFVVDILKTVGGDRCSVNLFFSTKTGNRANFQNILNWLYNRCLWGYKCFWDYFNSFWWEMGSTEKLVLPILLLTDLAQTQINPKKGIKYLLRRKYKNIWSQWPNLNKFHLIHGFVNGNKNQMLNICYYCLLFHHMKTHKLNISHLTINI